MMQLICYFVCADAKTNKVGLAAGPLHHFSHSFGSIVDLAKKKRKKPLVILLTRTGTCLELNCSKASVQTLDAISAFLVAVGVPFIIARDTDHVLSVL